MPQWIITLEFFCYTKVCILWYNRRNIILLYNIRITYILVKQRKPRQMENALRDIQCHLWVTSSQMWKVCWNKGRICWKITKLFYLSPYKVGQAGNFWTLLRIYIYFGITEELCILLYNRRTAYILYNRRNIYTLVELKNYI